MLLFPCLVALCAFSMLRLLYGQPDADLGGQRWRWAQEDSVREAAFRWQIAQRRYKQQVCFLTVTGRSTAANTTFVQRFRASAFVKPMSSTQSSGARSPMGQTQTSSGYIDTQTGMPALHFWMDAVTWNSDAEAEVAGGGAAANMSGNAGVFTVAWHNRRWNVTAYRIGPTF